MIKRYISVSLLCVGLLLGEEPKKEELAQSNPSISRPFVVCRKSTMGDFMNYLGGAYGYTFVCNPVLKVRTLNTVYRFKDSRDLMSQFFTEQAVGAKVHGDYNELTEVAVSRIVIPNNGISSVGIQQAFGGRVAFVDDKIICEGTASELEGLKKSIDLLKGRKRASVRIVAVMSDDATGRELGVEWEKFKVGFSHNSTNRVVNVSEFILDFEAILKARESVSVFDVKIDGVYSVVSGKPLSIFLGEEFQRTLSSGNDEVGTFATRIEGDNTGLSVNLTMFYDEKSWSGDLSFKDSRRTATDVVSKVEYTNHVVIEGFDPIQSVQLKRDWTLDEMKKIPFVSNVPVVGRLFQSKSTKHGKANFLIFLQMVDESLVTEKTKKSEVLK